VSSPVAIHPLNILTILKKGGLYIYILMLLLFYLYVLLNCMHTFVVLSTLKLLDEKEMLFFYIKTMR